MIIFERRTSPIFITYHKVFVSIIKVLFYLVEHLVELYMDLLGQEKAGPQPNSPRQLVGLGEITLLKKK